jgi:hypothetical protein
MPAPTAASPYWSPSEPEVVVGRALLRTCVRGAQAWLAHTVAGARDPAGRRRGGNEGRDRLAWKGDNDGVV